jgi:LPS-assembly protein
MPSPPTTKSTLNSLPRHCLAVIAALSTTLAAISVALAECPEAEPEPAGTRQSPAHSVNTAALPDADINLEVDDLDATRSGDWHLNGNVTISQGERQLKTRDAVYDPNTETFTTDHAVEYSDPTVKVQGSGAQFDPAGGADFKDAQFQLHGQTPQTQTGRGEASRINVTQQGKLSLDGVRYTTCPVGNSDWIIKASDIDISQQSGIGTGRNVRLDFKGIPILYTPFISFPIGNERKSGFLFPDFGTSSRSGTALVVPWYWNIAPNYDATFSPTWYSKRGGKLDTEFRYLTAFGHGAFNGEYLPDDREFGDSRSLLHFVDQSDFTQHMRLNVDASDVSDSDWFEDFGLGPEGTSISYLNRLTNLSYLSEHWFASAVAQNFQTIDDSIAVADRPYTLLPQFAVRANFPGQPYGLTLGMDGEWSNFQRSTGVTGTRIDIAPEIRMPLRGAGIYLEPAISWRYTKYSLNDTAPDADTTPSRSAQVFSVDGGMVFERTSGSKGQRLQTIEPRFMYLYVPYRDQRDLPVFDTDAADLNLVQLFRTNRYVGADRLSNANQVSVGLTSRLFEADTGQQFIAGTIGQAYYFDSPRPETSLPGEILPDQQSSDLVAELEVTAFRNWNIRMGVAWDPGDMRSEKGDVHLQYRPAHDRVMNLGYRFRRDIIEQVDGSVAWPLGDRWSIYGRMVYSLDDKTTLDQADPTRTGKTALDKFAGLEYRSCCWRVRFVARQYVSDRAGNIDTSYLLQLELNGLSSVGVAADAFLERSIQGYSSRTPQP